MVWHIGTIPDEPAIDLRFAANTPNPGRRDPSNPTHVGGALYL
jgi:hypothetical protein